MAGKKKIQEKAKEYRKWFDQIAFLDPNDFGPDGYTLIGPLLLFYRGVVAHNPAVAHLNLARKYYYQATLDMNELEDAAVGVTGETILSFTVFPTFFNRKYREERYPLFLRVTEADFDKKLLDPNSNLRRTIHEVDDKREESASKALELLDNSDIVSRVEQLIYEYRNGGSSFSSRFKRALSDPQFEWPGPLQKVIPSLDPTRRTALLAGYDFYNDKVLQAAGGAAVAIPTRQGEETARVAHGLEPMWLPRRDVKQELRAIIQPCLDTAPKKNLP